MNQITIPADIGSLKRYIQVLIAAVLMAGGWLHIHISKEVQKVSEAMADSLRHNLRQETAYELSRINAMLVQQYYQYAATTGLTTETLQELATQVTDIRQQLANNNPNANLQQQTKELQRLQVTLGVLQKELERQQPSPNSQQPTPNSQQPKANAHETPFKPAVTRSRTP